MEKIELNLIYKYTETSEYHPLAEKSIVPAREREIETVFAMGNGYIGTRNSLEESYPESDPGSFVAGMYVQGPDDDFNFLVRLPDWTAVKIYVGGDLLNLRKNNILRHIRYIDFENGTVIREWKSEDEEGRITNVKILKYISLAEKHELGKLVIIKPENYSEKISVITGIDCNAADFGYLLNMNSEVDDFASVFMKTKYTEKYFAILQKSSFLPHWKGREKEIEYNYSVKNLYEGSFENYEWQGELGNTYLIKSLACVCTSLESDDPIDKTISCYQKYNDNFFDESFIKHTNRWKERFNESEIKIADNEYDQKLVDFALYHLITAGEFSGGRNSVPARDLSGESYKGHVFWDTEMYLLPFFIYTRPEIARNLLMYRYNTLDGARENAVNEGFRGASFGWESTDSGLEAAPEMVVLPSGEVIEILSGQYENHLPSDIAYTIGKYWEATCDDEFMINYGAEIIFETARFCTSLLEKGDDGLYHINFIIGPDEYHEKVDDNAFTNYLVNHNFEIAIKVYEWMKSEYSGNFSDLAEKISLKENEINEWEKYKDNIYTGYDHKTKLYEQFKGFYDLEYINLEEYEPRSVPMDVILGREKTRKTQVIKQADVLMFMMLFGERFSKEQIQANYEYYEKRCGHGSSLSPSIHSVMAARAGKREEAYEYFLKNAKIDIGDAFGNAAGGIHIASLGGVWLSLVYGFAGMYPTERGLIFDPILPDEWDNIEFSVKWRSRKVNIFIDHKKIKFFSKGENSVNISAGPDNWKEILPDTEYFAEKRDQKWEWKE